MNLNVVIILQFSMTFESAFYFTFLILFGLSRCLNCMSCAYTYFSNAPEKKTYLKELKLTNAIRSKTIFSSSVFSSYSTAIFLVLEVLLSGGDFSQAVIQNGLNLGAD